MKENPFIWKKTVEFGEKPLYKDHNLCFLSQLTVLLWWAWTSPEIADISSPLTTVSGILYNTKKQKNPGVAGSNPNGVQKNFFLGLFLFSFPKIFFSEGE